jgi:hypothetical protein
MHVGQHLRAQKAPTDVPDGQRKTSGSSQSETAARADPLAAHDKPSPTAMPAVVQRLAARKDATPLAALVDLFDANAQPVDTQDDQAEHQRALSATSSSAKSAPAALIAFFRQCGAAQYQAKNRPMEC